MIYNLTPHNIEIYPVDAPDVIDPATATLLRTLPAVTGRVARIVEYELGTFYPVGAEAVPMGIERVEFGHVIGLPAAQPGVWFIVSLATALAMPKRADLLVPWRQVRNERGTVVGCRGLARPC